MGEVKYGLSLWDESASFMSSFGLYKGSNGAGYDRSIILELYNAPRRFKRDLKSSRTIIENPRLNICVLGHPDSYIKVIQDERANKDDGMMQRFLLCAPEPAYFTAKEIKTNNQNHCSLEKVFFTVYLIHETNINYSLDEKADELFCTLYTQYKKLVEKCNLCDVFLRFKIFYFLF